MLLLLTVARTDIGYAFREPLASCEDGCRFTDVHVQAPCVHMHVSVAVLAQHRPQGPLEHLVQKDAALHAAHSDGSGAC